MSRPYGQDAHRASEPDDRCGVSGLSTIIMSGGVVAAGPSLPGAPDESSEKSGWRRLGCERTKNPQLRPTLTHRDRPVLPRPVADRPAVTSGASPPACGT